MDHHANQTPAANQVPAANQTLAANQTPAANQSPAVSAPADQALAARPQAAAPEAEEARTPEVRREKATDAARSAPASRRKGRALLAIACLLLCAALQVFCGRYGASRYWESHDARALRSTIGLANLRRAVCVLPDGRLAAADAGMDNFPAEAGQWDDLTSVSVGTNSLAAIRADGSVAAAAWDEEYAPEDLVFRGSGAPDAGQFDVSDWSNMILVRAGSSYTVGLQRNGKLALAGEWSATFGGLESLFGLSELKMKHWNGLVDFDCSDTTGCAVGVRYNGRIVSAGFTGGNLDRIRREMNRWEDVVRVCVDGYDVYALRSDGTVVTTNESMDLSEWTDVVSISGDSLYLLGLRKDGTVLAAQSADQDPETAQWLAGFSSWRDIREIFAGDTAAIGVHNDGSIEALEKFEGLLIEDSVSQWHAADPKSK